MRVGGVTLGAEGSLLFAGGEFIETPGCRVPGVCRDTTGAGDAYRVGIIYGLLRGRSIEDTARIANAVAQRSSAARSAREPLCRQRKSWLGFSQNKFPRAHKTFPI